MRELAERAGISVTETGSLDEQKREAEARRRKDELFGAGSAAAEYFERCLEQHPLAPYASSDKAPLLLWMDGHGLGQCMPQDTSQMVFDGTGIRQAQRNHRRLTRSLEQPRNLPRLWLAHAP